MKLILIGDPGAGKGTQAEILCRMCDIPTISTGNILRAAVKNGTPVGLKAKDYIENGNIKNSVNFPSISVPRSEHPRVCVMHDNVPNILAQITSAFSAKNINIESINSGSKGEVAYTIVETITLFDKEIVDKIAEIKGVFGVRPFNA